MYEMLSSLGCKANTVLNIVNFSIYFIKKVRIIAYIRQVALHIIKSKRPRLDPCCILEYGRKGFDLKYVFQKLFPTVKVRMEKGL